MKSILRPPTRARKLAVQRGLLLSARKRPGGLPAALLAEDEVHLLRRAQALGMVGPERRARLVERQCAEHVLTEEAVVAADAALACSRQSPGPRLAIPPAPPRAAPRLQVRKAQTGRVAQPRFPQIAAFSSRSRK